MEWKSRAAAGVPTFHLRLLEWQSRRGDAGVLHLYHVRGTTAFGWNIAAAAALVVVFVAVASTFAVAAVAALWKKRVPSSGRACWADDTVPGFVSMLPFALVLATIVASLLLLLAAAGAVLAPLAVSAPPPPELLCAVVRVAASFVGGI